MANSVHPDQTPQNAASDPGLQFAQAYIRYFMVSKTYYTMFLCGGGRGLKKAEGDGDC